MEKRRRQLGKAVAQRKEAGQLAPALKERPHVSVYRQQWELVQWQPVKRRRDGDERRKLIRGDAKFSDHHRRLVQKSVGAKPGRKDRTRFVGFTLGRNHTRSEKYI